MNMQLLTELDRSDFHLLYIASTEMVLVDTGQSTFSTDHSRGGRVNAGCQLAVLPVWGLGVRGLAAASPSELLIC